MKELHLSVSLFLSLCLSVAPGFFSIYIYHPVPMASRQLRHDRASSSNITAFLYQFIHQLEALKAYDPYLGVMHAR